MIILQLLIAIPNPNSREPWIVTPDQIASPTACDSGVSPFAM